MLSPRNGDVVVGKSRIRGAGEGVFSNRDLDEDAVIGEYTGKLVSLAAWVAMPPERRAYACAVHVRTRVRKRNGRLGRRARAHARTETERSPGLGPRGAHH
jgi:hypothetical protein